MQTKYIKEACLRDRICSWLMKGNGVLVSLSKGNSSDSCKPGFKPKHQLQNKSETALLAAKALAQANLPVDAFNLQQGISVTMTRASTALQSISSSVR
jgi:hypothetical protein